MMPNIRSGTSLYGALAYHRDKIEKDKAELIFTNKILLPGGDPSRLTLPAIREAFAPYLPEGIRARQTIFHASLNPHPDDKLSRDEMAEIAREFMERMGYDEQPYVVYLHRDIDRWHLHIVSSRIRPDGSKISDSMEGQRSQDICRDLERKYRLRPLKSGEEPKLNPYRLKTVEYARGDIKQQIGSTVRAALSRYGFASVKELNTLLNQYRV